MSADDDQPLLLSPEQVVTACGLSRPGVHRAIERGELPATRFCSRLRILLDDFDPGLFANSKDSDAVGYEHGIARFRALVDEAHCAISWRARELFRGVTPQDDAQERRAALARAGDWLGTLPARYALEQEEAVRHVADQCCYLRAALALEVAFT